uniref:prion protein b n=1 Tax=Semicossyphus pulcher TaxID=241346 RepID=UPI0037E835A0
MAKKGGSGGFSKGFGSKKTSWSNKGSTNTKTNTGQRKNQGSNSQGGSKQPGQHNTGGSPRQYPVQGSQYGGGYDGYGAHGGRYGGVGGYPGGYVNHNPKNKILSPGYGGSFGYGANRPRGGSPFSQSVQQMGMYPNERSRGFGRSAVMAAGGGAVAGMALGYGLGRFQRPHFHFRNSQEEYFYNHYMYRNYGTKSTDTNDYSRDYKYSQPLETYGSYMDSCMKRPDILPAENPKPTKKTAAMIPDTGMSSNTTETNNTDAEIPLTSEASAQRPLNQPVAFPLPQATPVPEKTASNDDDDDDDTVSIVAIGYPALINQLKVRRCVEMYMVYSEKYLKKKTEPSPGDGVQGLEMGWQGPLAVVTSTILMLLNSNMLTLLH